MCMMSFIELQKISELSFECMFGLLCNVKGQVALEEGLNGLVGFTVNG